eukprot:gene7475-8305_t
MAEQQVERAMSGDESSGSSENSTARDPRGDQDTLEDLKEYREINKEVNEDAIEELKSLTAQKETDSQRLAELRYTLEPTIKEIEVLDKKIQGMMKKLRLKRELINELKTCRAYHAKVKTLMQRAKEHEASNKKASLSGTTRQQEHRQGGRKESLSPPPLFHIGDDRTVTAPSISNQATIQVTGTADKPSSYDLFGMQGMPEPTGQIHRPEISATANTGQTFSRPDIFGMRMGNEDQGNPRTGWEWPTNTRSAYAEMVGQPRANSASSIRLPKIEMKSFNGDPKEWIQFWDVFERNIHLNTSLAKVSKMQYLKGLLKGAAANAISHLLITEDNYQPAVEALKQRYGQPALLRNSHLAALKEVEPVYNSKELTRLRRLHDEVDCHYKALTVMGVKSETYSMVIMPDLMKKIPRDIVVSVKRLRDVNYDWQLGEFLEGLWNELVIRGLHETNSNTREISKDHKTGKVFSIANKLCPFCLAEHPAEDCDKVTDIEERRQLVKRYKRCFQCLKKGHRARDCYLRKECSKCKKQGHHASICKEEHAANLHVTGKSSIAYQTVQAIVNLPGKNEVRCRMLLDTGCDRSYMTQEFANKLKGKPIRYERKILDTVHGEKTHNCAVFLLEMKNGKGELQCTAEVSTLSKLTSDKWNKWQGGFYERLIGVTKKTLFKAIGRSVLRFRELETMLIKVEGLLNNRPLTYQTEELDLEVITPNHLIFGHALPIIGDHDEDSEEDVVFTKRMKYLESKKNHIWTRWMKEYILNLREYHKIITTIVDPPRLGQLVLIVDDSVRRRYWQMGKIVKQLKSKDGVTRAVKVQIASQGKLYEIERPLQGICPLEIDAPINKEKNDVSQLRIQPRRAAATSGENRRKLSENPQMLMESSNMIAQMMEYFIKHHSILFPVTEDERFFTPKSPNGTPSKHAALPSPIGGPSLIDFGGSSQHGHRKSATFPRFPRSASADAILNPPESLPNGKIEASIEEQDLEAQVDELASELELQRSQFEVQVGELEKKLDAQKKVVEMLKIRLHEEHKARTAAELRLELYRVGIEEYCQKFGGEDIGIHLKDE